MLPLNAPESEDSGPAIPNSMVNCNSLEAIAPPLSTLEQLTESAVVVSQPAPLTTAKEGTRTSLKASTLDGVFATIFSNIAGGVLLGNFLLELGANPVEIGMLASVPMLVNLIQPIGAHWADRTNSRHWYCFWIYAPSRLLWLILVLGIGFVSWHPTEPHLLIKGTLLIVLLTHLLGALGSASWLSWMAAIVPRQLRGRYFGIRNSAINLTTLISVPLLGLGVSAWPGGSIQGYGIFLALGIVAGLISLGFQTQMVDINPQEQHHPPEQEAPPLINLESAEVKPLVVGTEPLLENRAKPKANILKDVNFLIFLVYFGFWTFAVNLSAPFFNLYLLSDLHLDVSWVTLYNSLSAGANLLMLVAWGKIADRRGNRPILLLVGILVAITPILWLGVGHDTASIWLWLPLLHMLGGATWAAIDLCSNNIQMAVAPIRFQAKYFAIAAAVAGVSGALGTTVGSLLAQFANYGGLPGLFALSSVVRLIALLPLVFVQEQRSQPIIELVQILKQNIQARLLMRPRLVPARAGSLGNGSK